MAAENVPGNEDGEISLHALKGCPTKKIIKVEGQVGNGKLMVLIESGSTHSFLDENTAKELHCKVKITFPFSVTVGNGNKMYSKSRCVDFG